MRFRHPSVQSGAITHGPSGTIAPIVDGIVELDPLVGQELSLEPVAELAATATPTGIALVNATDAKALIAESTTVEHLDAHAADEATRKDGERVSVVRAIEEKRAELAATATPTA